MLATLALPATGLFPALERIPTVRVRSADELKSALRRARERALALDASGLDRVLRLDAPRGILELQAATPWAALLEYLAPHQIPLQAFANAPQLPATVGDAVSLDSPGPDGLAISAHVAALTLVTPDGELRRADPQANRELFSLALGGRGLFGVLYSVTLSLDSLRRSAAEAVPPVELIIPDVRETEPSGEALECLLPPGEVDGFLARLRELARERRFVLHGVSVQRQQPARAAFLRCCEREWAGVQLRFGVKATLGASVHAAEIRRLLLGMALERGGMLALRDPRDATREQLNACYPMLATFLAEKRRYDPAERLQNAWYRCVLAKQRGASCEVRWAR